MTPSPDPSLPLWQILMLGSEQALAEALCDFGFEVCLADSLTEALHFLDPERNQTLLPAAGNPGIGVLAELQKLLLDFHHLQILLRIPSDMEATLRGMLPAPRLRWLPLEADAGRIYTLLSQPLSQGLTGQMTYISVLDLLRLAVVDGRPRLLHFREDLTGAEGLCYLAQGHLTHAEFFVPPRTFSRGYAPDFTGEEAFFRIATLRSGNFLELPWSEPPACTVTESLEALALAAAARVDEIRAASGSAHDRFLDFELRRACVLIEEPVIRRSLRQLFQRLAIPLIMPRRRGDLAQYQGQPFELLLVKQEELSLAELDALRARRPSLRLILLHAGPPSFELLAWASADPFTRLLERPLSLDTLAHWLSGTQFAGFRGQLVEQVGVLEFIQSALTGGGRKLLGFKSSEGQDLGLLWIQRGQFVHAQTEDQRGEDAFFAMTRLRQGEFREVPWREPPMMTLREIVPHKLLMRATLQLHAASPPAP
jgi:hypothetical protein